MGYPNKRKWRERRRELGLKTLVPSVRYRSHDDGSPWGPQDNPRGKAPSGFNRAAWRRAQREARRNR